MYDRLIPICQPPERGILRNLSGSSLMIEFPGYSPALRSVALPKKSRLRLDVSTIRFLAWMATPML